MIFFLPMRNRNFSFFEFRPPASRRIGVLTQSLSPHLQFLFFFSSSSLLVPSSLLFISSPCCSSITPRPLCCCCCCLCGLTVIAVADLCALLRSRPVHLQLRPQSAKDHASGSLTSPSFLLPTCQTAGLAGKNELLLKPSRDTSKPQDLRLIAQSSIGELLLLSDNSLLTARLRHRRHGSKHCRLGRQLPPPNDRECLQLPGHPGL